VYKSH